MLVDCNGDPRYVVSDTIYYSLYSKLETERNPIPVIGIEDSENGYIAFCTDLTLANRIAMALDLLGEAENLIKEIHGDK